MLQTSVEQKKSALARMLGERLVRSPPYLAQCACTLDWQRNSSKRENHSNRLNVPAFHCLEIGTTMPLRNRVTPYGEIIAVPERGLFTGNRGVLHTLEQKVVHYNRGRRWIICQLEFKGWHREVMQPNRWTELFFLDEATALAAGHRPCAMCRYRNYQSFRRSWALAHDLPLQSADAMDLVMHQDRLARPRVRRTFVTDFSSLPDGVFIVLDDQPWLLHETELHHWTPGGYDQRIRCDNLRMVQVLTPKCTVATIACGYQPLLHPSAVMP